jgi:glycolate oxidase
MPRCGGGRRRREWDASGMTGHATYIRTQPRDELVQELAGLLDPGCCLYDPAALIVYGRDASRCGGGRPLAVALPRTATQVASVVAWCARRGVVFVARGAGTGLSGGALPPEGAVVISLARLSVIGPVDEEARLIRVGAGAVNERVGEVAAGRGLRFAPDPSSQSAATIGGNVATNAGGAHCLRDGATVHHLARLSWVAPTGQTCVTSRGLTCERGIDLAALLTGSEGCLGIVTAAELRLVRAEEKAATLLASFSELTATGVAVSELLTQGQLPAALELIDRPMIEAVEAAYRLGLPVTAAAMLLVDLSDGPGELDGELQRAENALRRAGAVEVRRALTSEEREALWLCRKKAFGAIGRLAPAYVSLDVVVPLGELPGMLDDVAALRRAHGVRIATACHAGDGNLHPGIQYDPEDPQEVERAERAAVAVCRAALARGGSISGEHGVGGEKRELAGEQLDPVCAELMAGIKSLCDPRDLCNPGKGLPAGGVGLAPPSPPPGVPEFRWDSLTVTVPAESPLEDIQERALARGFWLPVGLVRRRGEGPGLAAAGNVAELIDQLLVAPGLLARGTARDSLLQVWAETVDGRAYRAGAPVFKNVVGWNIGRLLCGGGGLLGRIRGATFQLRPAPEVALVWQARSDAPGMVPAAAAELLERLRTWAGPLCAPSCVLDDFEVGERTVSVFLAGRADHGDLDDRVTWLDRWARTTGLRPAFQERLPFRELGRLAVHVSLPRWARQCGDWTVQARLPGSSGWPTLLGHERIIWQGSPELLWLPVAHRRAEPGWHADTVWRGGRPTPLPEPAPEVPRRLLAGLRDLFDPQGWLPEPEWLESTRQGEG